MKKSLLLIFVFCTSYSGAQDMSANSFERPDANTLAGTRIQKGTFLTTGNFLFQSYSSDLIQYSNFEVGISALMGLSPRFGIGITTGYRMENSEFDSGSLTVNSNFNQFEIGPALRAFGRIHWGRLQPYGQLDIPFSFGKSENGGKTELSSYGIGIRPGLTAYLTRRLALEASLGVIEYVENTSTTGALESQTSNFNLGLSLDNVQFGLVLLFNSL